MKVRDLLRIIRQMNPEIEIVVEAYNPAGDCEIPSEYGFEKENLYRNKKANKLVIILSHQQHFQLTHREF